MKERRKFITERTIINIDEEYFKELAEELICELFVDYVNDKYGRTVIEKKVGK
ncbi:hypothetical protein NDK43_04020 [Neobacillus pocheonensis]|uniref:Uncharacterized protein n=1 Tax=Neobacillus pocheonensis TaxID=363869 RepID=A0ABT0W5V9_9BACI|nr:hypothetical protein [Neobacillus pocheonensis]